MYSEEFVKYLLKYPSNTLKPKEEPQKKKYFNLYEVKKKYATVPLTAK